jgi:hypothetical protein
MSFMLVLRTSNCLKVKYSSDVLAKLCAELIYFKLHKTSAEPVIKGGGKERKSRGRVKEQEQRKKA